MKRSNEPPWMRQMTVTRGEKAKLYVFFGLALLLLIYIASRRSLPSNATSTKRETPRDIKSDLLPLKAGATKASKAGADTPGPPKPGQAGESDQPSETQQASPPADFPYAADVLDQIVDRSHSLEEEPYYYLAHWISQRTSQQLQEAADPSITWGDLFLNPGKHRGKVVRFTGTLKRLRVMPLDPGNPCGLEQVYQGQIRDRDYRIWTFVLVEKPPESVLEESVVQMTGAFFKTWEYETLLANTYKITPVVIGRSIVNVDFSRDSTTRWAIVAAVVVAVMAMIVFIRAQRSKDEEYDRERREKMKSRRPRKINEIAKTLSAKASREQQELQHPRSQPLPDGSDRPQKEGLGETDNEQSSEEVW